MAAPRHIMTDLELTFKIKPELDEQLLRSRVGASVDFVEAAYGALGDVELFGPDSFASLDDASDGVTVLQSALAGVAVEGVSSFSRLGDSVFGVADAAKDLASSMSSDGLLNIDGIANIALGFDSALEASEEFLVSQKRALAAMVAAGEEGSDQYLDLVSDIIQTKEEIQRLRDAQQHVVDLFDEPIDVKLNMPSENQSPMESMFAYDSIEKAGSFLSETAERGAELNSALRSIGATTGLVGDEIERVADNAEEAFDQGIGESLAEATKIMAVAEQQLARFLNPGELDDFLVRAQGISKTFDVDVNEVIGKGRTLIAQWGLSGQEAGDLISLTMQKAGNSTGDVLDTLDEYSQHVKNLGFDAAEFVGILNKSIQEGSRDSDKIGDLLKESGIRAAAGDIKSALSDISSPITATIQGIVQAQEQGEISVRELLTRSATVIEEAYNAGTITDNIRSQLQTAISGTPAEDIGADLYGRIFGSPIDTSAVSSQAALAGEQMIAAMEPTVGERLGRLFESVGDKASALVAPVASVGGEALGIVAQLGPAMSFLKDADLFPIDGLGQFAGKLGDLQGIATKAGPLLSGAFSAMTGPVGLAALGIAGLTAGVVAFFSSTEQGQQIWKRITDEVEDLYDLAQPVLEEIGDSLLTIGEFAFEYMLTPFELAWSVLEGIGMGIGSLISMFAGASSGGDSLTASLTSMESILSTVRISIEAALAGFKEFKEGVGDAVKKLLSGDVLGAVEEATSLGDRVGTAFNKAVAEGVREESLDDMKKGLERASDIQIKVKAGLDLNSLAADYSKAQQQVASITERLASAKISGNDAEVRSLTKELTEAELRAAGFADKLQQQVPTAVKGVRTIRDESGNLKTVYQINTEQVTAFASAQQKAFGSELQQQTVSYSQNLQQVAADYRSQHQELEQLQTAINKGDATDAQIKRFNELASQANSSREAMVQAFTDGTRAGLVTDDAVRDIARALGISEQEARGLVKTQQEHTRAAVQGKRTVDELGNSFSESMKKAQEEVGKLQAAYAETLRTGEGDPSILENLRRAQGELQNLESIQTRASETAEDIERRNAEWDKANELRAIGRDERTRRSAIQRITDERRRGEEEIELEHSVAVRREQAEARFQERMLAIAKDANERQGALQALRDARDRIEQANTEATTRKRELAGDFAVRAAEKALEAEQRRSEKETQLDQDRLARLQETGAQTADALQRQKELELRIVTEGARRQAVAEVEATTEFQSFRDNLLAKVKADPTAFTPDDVVRQLTAERERIAKRLASGTDPISEAYRSIFAAATAKGAELSAEYDYRIEEARIKALPDRLQRETELRLLNARKMLQEELRVAGESDELRSQAEERFARERYLIEEERAIAAETDLAVRTRRLRLFELDKTFHETMEAARGNQSLERQAFVEFQQEKVSIERDFARESAREMALALTVAESLFLGFLNEIDEERRKELEKQLDDVATHLDEVIAEYQDEEISLADYYDRREDLLAEAYEAERELALAHFDFLRDLNEGLAAGFSAIRDQYRESARQAAEEFSTLASLSADELSRLGLTNDDITTRLTDSWIETGIAIAAAVAETGAQGENMLKGFANATLDIAAKTLEAQIPALVALIFGKSIAENPLMGGIVAGVATAALYGLVAIAKSALSGAQFYEGGYTGDGDPHDAAGTVHRGEFVHTAVTTSVPENRALFEHLHEGGSQREWFELQRTIWGYDEPPVFYIGADGKLHEGAAQAEALERQVQSFAERFAQVHDPEQGNYLPDLRGAIIHGRDMTVVARAEDFLQGQRLQTEAIERQTAVLERRLEELTAEFQTQRGQQQTALGGIERALRELQDAVSFDVYLDGERISEQVNTHNARTWWKRS